jgi:LytR cell envelope-related transcriptional attenuator
MEPTTDERDRTERPPRPYKAPRVGDSRAPVTTIIVLAVGVVAVVIGLVILSSISGDSTRPEAGQAPSAVASTPPISIVGIPTAAPTTTAAAAAAAPTAGKGDAPLLVVNASGVGGSASSMMAELAADGYAASKVANAKGGRLEQTVVYFVAGDAVAEGVARVLSAQIPQAQVEPMPDPPPIDRPLNGATVALMIGRDIAGRSLAGLAAG